MTVQRSDTDAQHRSSGGPVSRRQVLRSTAAGSLGVACLATVGSAAARQGGVAYLEEKHLYGKNNPDETRYKIVGRCGTTRKTLDCESGQARTYAKYRIRCPNFPDGGPGAGGESDGRENGGHENGHDDPECPGGDGGGGGDGCGRHVLVNPDRRIETNLTQLYEFVVTHDCGDEYVKAAFRPVG